MEVSKLPKGLPRCSWTYAIPCDNSGNFVCGLSATCSAGAFSAFSVQKTSTGMSAATGSSSISTISVSVSRTTETETVVSTAASSKSSSGTLPTSTAPPASSAAALGPGAIAGIAIGSIAVLGAALAIWLVLSWRRKVVESGQAGTGAHIPPPVYHDSMIKGPLEGQLPQTQSPVEVHAISYVPEMDGRGVGR
ncbi:hypothetical protein F5882DRAFT_467367 [Hyaloscypha sp. PMI_1271]|nr:hypothetical protein F5882DRAFT_467367 [Hyaloscypha sp. PMI_1271]